MTGLYHGWDHDKDSHADFRHNGVGVEDFDETFRHKKKSSRGRPKKKRGCPENDFGPHVWVWVPQVARYLWWPEYEDDFYKKYGFFRQDAKTCCGCGKTNGSRYSEEMNKRIDKLGWYKAQY